MTLNITEFTGKYCRVWQPALTKRGGYYRDLCCLRWRATCDLFSRLKTACSTVDADCPIGVAEQMINNIDDAILRLEDARQELMNYTMDYESLDE